MCVHVCVCVCVCVYLKSFCLYSISHKYNSNNFFLKVNFLPNEIYQNFITFNEHFIMKMNVISYHFC